MSRRFSTARVPSVLSAFLAGFGPLSKAAVVGPFLYVFVPVPMDLKKVLLFGLHRGSPVAPDGIVRTIQG